MSTRRSLVLSALDRYSAFFVSLISTIVLSRILTPAEIGVFSVTMAFLAFLQTMRDFGAGQYLVQEKHLDRAKIQTVWTIQLGIGLSFAILIYASRGFVADFYKDPRMEAILVVVALNFAINPIGAITYAWLIREMKFGSLAVMRFSSSIVGAIVAIVLALRGFGAISLAWGSVASTVVSALVSVALRPPNLPWLPGLSGFRAIMKFGTQATSISILNTISRSAPDLFLGKLQSMTAVGLYSRGNGFISMFERFVLDAVWTVTMPMFAKISREQGNLGQIYTRATAYLVAIAWSFTLGVVFLGEPLIRLLYGEQWLASSSVAVLLAVTVAVQAPSFLCAHVLLGHGRNDLNLRVTAWTTILRVPGLLVGAHFGLLAAAASTIPSAAVATAIWILMVAKTVVVDWRTFNHQMIRSAIVALCAGIGPALLKISGLTSSVQPIAVILIGVVTSALGFIAALYVTKHPLNDETINILNRFRHLHDRLVNPPR